jgi:hypothetical protein
MTNALHGTGFDGEPMIWSTELLLAIKPINMGAATPKQTTPERAPQEPFETANTDSSIAQADGTHASLHAKTTSPLDTTTK